MENGPRHGPRFRIVVISFMLLSLRAFAEACPAPDALWTLADADPVEATKAAFAAGDGG